MAKTMSLYLFIGMIYFSCKSDTVNKEMVKEIAETKVEKQKKMENLDINYCMGNFDPGAHLDFVRIPIKHADREGMLMHKEAYEAFVKMYNDAKTKGIIMQIRSATRNFNYQKGIWERKWTGATKLSDGTDVSKDIKEPVAKALKILEYSSMPGTSRHHWGTDIDINSFNNSYFEAGEGKVLYDWMIKNAHQYGFCQPYTPKDSARPDGYNEEKWHWSYTPLSNEITQYAEEYLKNEMIKGFLGSETAGEIDVVKNYVLGINKGCRH